MSSISFDNVWLLFIALPLVVLFTVPFCIAVRKDNANGHNIASVIMHVVMAALIAFAAAGTQVVTVMTETDVYVVADVSYSAEKNLDTIDGYIENLELPRNSKLGVICFGKDYKLVTDLGKSFRTVKNSGVDDRETNIAQALEYAGTLFKDDVIKRVVLITDGRDSYPEDANKLKRAVDSLVAKNIQVDAIYLDDNITEDSQEVQISSAEFTKTAYIDRTETVNVYVQANCATYADITLYKDGEPYGDKKENQRLTLGMNNISFMLDTTEAGTYDYRVELKAVNDECDFNNSYSFTQTVSDVVNVLLIADNSKDLNYVEGLYSDETQIDSYIGTPDVPVNVEALAKYDEIIISDIDLTTVNNYELLVQSLDTVVSKFGKSLITFGDIGIQDANGELSAMDDILPVKYGNSVLAPKLYTILIDVSHSMMAGHSRFKLAKLAAVQLVNLLGEDDYVRVFTTSGTAKSIFYGRVGPNRDQLVENIKNLNSEQGTYLGLGLDTVLSSIKNADFAEKQVMLITDGLPFDGPVNYGQDKYPNMTDKQIADFVVETMAVYGIHTSVIEAGSSNGASETGGSADSEWLMGLAVKGGGSYHAVRSEPDLGSAIFDEIKEDNKPVITNTWITNVRPRDSALTGVSTELSYVSDYVLGKVKASANEVMRVTYQAGRVTADVPLYAYWSYGNGKAASYAGKLNEIKKRDGTNINDAFFGNVLDTLMPAEKIDYPYTVTTEITEKIAKISVTPAELYSKASAEITVTKPDGESYTEPLVFDSANYNHTVILTEAGKYEVEILYSYNGEEYRADATFNVSYEPEYDAFAVYEASGIYKMIGSNGVVSEDGKLEIVNDQSRIATYVIKLTVPLLVIAVVLFVVDIAVRKLKWKDIVSLFGKGKDGGTGGKGGGKK